MIDEHRRAREICGQILLLITLVLFGRARSAWWRRQHLQSTETSSRIHLPSGSTISIPTPTPPPPPPTKKKRCVLSTMIGIYSHLFLHSELRASAFLKTKANGNNTKWWRSGSSGPENTRSIFHCFPVIMPRLAWRCDHVNPLTSRPGCMPGSRYTGVGVLFFVIWSWNC